MQVFSKNSVTAVIGMFICPDRGSLLLGCLDGTVEEIDLNGQRTDGLAPPHVHQGEFLNTMVLAGRGEQLDKHRAVVSSLLFCMQVFLLYFSNLKQCKHLCTDILTLCRRGSVVAFGDTALPHSLSGSH